VELKNAKDRSRSLNIKQKDLRSDVICLPNFADPFGTVSQLRTEGPGVQSAFAMQVIPSSSFYGPASEEVRVCKQQVESFSRRRDDRERSRGRHHRQGRDRSRDRSRGRERREVMQVQEARRASRADASKRTEAPPAKATPLVDCSSFVGTPMGPHVGNSAEGDERHTQTSIARMSCFCTVPSASRILHKNHPEHTSMMSGSSSRVRWSLREILSLLHTTYYTRP
jgi:hypothetical protein